MTTDKTYPILRYTDAHFRGTGTRARARIHVWDPGAKRTFCGLDVPYLRSGDVPKPAPEWALKEGPHCARCETAQRKRLASGGDRTAAGLALAEARSATRTMRSFGRAVWRGA